MVPTTSTRTAPPPTLSAPWIKRESIDHRFNNTDTVLKTMECLLGLQPMSQYDAIALPIMDWDISPSNNKPYNAVLPPKQIIAQINTPAPAARKPR